MDETGTHFNSKLIIGFPVGDIQRSYVIVDKTLKKQYQSSPGRQEWITAIECICADRSHISPFLIFKGENFVSNWLLKDTLFDWKYSVNSKG